MNLWKRVNYYLFRRAARVTAGYLETRTNVIVQRWLDSLSAEVPRYREAITDAEERGCLYVGFIAGEMRADTDAKRAELMSQLSDYGKQAAQNYLEKGLELHEILRASSLFRSAVLTDVELMLRKRLWLALPQDVLKAEEYINQALDSQMLLTSSAYIEQRDRIIEMHQAALEESNSQLLSFLGEMQHRIKNNLQTMVDLLSLEMLHGDCGESIATFERSISRVKAIAAVHSLTRSEQVEHVNVTEVARRVAGTTLKAHHPAGSEASVVVEGYPIWLPSKEATALALVLNELLVEVLRSVPVASGREEVRIQMEERADSIGVHLAYSGEEPVSMFDAGCTNKIGLQIINSLVRHELNGSLNLAVENGTIASLRIPK